VIHGTTRLRDRHTPGKGLNTGEERQQPLVIHVRYCRATFLLTVFMPDIADALVEERNGTIISIDVTAGSKTELFPAGYNEWRKAIGCRVTAQALEGKANKAILALIAGTLDLPLSSISILSGATSSQKRVLIAGVAKSDLVLRLNSHSR
jgi:uncharacterized protein (TIGR00251 family)